MTIIICAVSIISAIFATDKIAKIVKLQSASRVFLWLIVGMILSFVFSFILFWILEKILGKEKYKTVDEWVDEKLKALIKTILCLFVGMCFAFGFTYFFTEILNFKKLSDPITFIAIVGGLVVSVLTEAGYREIYGKGRKKEETGKDKQ